jgi:nitrate/nitrite transport system ATP-binding protein
VTQPAPHLDRPLEITSLTKSWGDYTAVKGFNVRIEPGEFVCLLGHSGCGKSTVLSIIAGLDHATEGGVCIDGREIDSPGTERGVVFQSPSLLPWLSAIGNVTLASAQAFPQLGRGEQKKHAMKYLTMTGVDDVASHSPADLSLGTQQRVAIARALSLEPRFLLLDEPFGMLDTLTRFELQDMLLSVWEQSRKTVVMVTHDIDEALYLSDRIVLMTDGPASRVGEIIGVPWERPRDRAQVLKHRDYRGLRGRVLDFLENHANHGKS